MSDLPKYIEISKRKKYSLLIGEICGTADNAEKPYLLFFDLTRCIKISAALSGCITPQVCVSKCPDEYWSYATGLTTDLKQYCTGAYDIVVEMIG